MENENKALPVVIVSTFTFQTTGVEPHNRAFAFNLQAKDIEEARVALIADLQKVISNLEKVETETPAADLG